MSILDAFKLKPYDLEPVFQSWPNARKFTGNPKKDPPVDEWLREIKEGCVQRNVPKEYWHKVGQHYMGEKAKARLVELKNVMAKVHGGKYRWDWKKYKIAMLNMGWNLDASETETVKVHAKRSGLWWITRKDETIAEGSMISPIEPCASSRPPPQRSESMFWISRKPSHKESEKEAAPVVEKAKETRSGEGFWPVRKGSKDESQDGKEPAPEGFWSIRRTATEQSVSAGKELKPTRQPSKDWKRPVPRKAKSDGAMLHEKDFIVVDNDETVTSTAQAPAWLINACNALDFLHNEHPKVMSTVGAILVTVGSIPAIPAISAGAGGALLASGAIQALGAIAVGVGSMLNAQSQVRQGSTPSESGKSSEKGQ